MGMHTKGPWHVAGWNGRVDGAKQHYGPHAGVWSDDDTLIAPCGPIDDPESMANAFLIAAAPELLAALEDIIKRNEIQNWFNLDQARNAVAKAEGRDDIASPH